MNEAGEMEDYIINRYDQLCDWTDVNDYYGHSDFLNFGYWEVDTENQKEACENLMTKLLAFLPDTQGNILDVACGKGETTAFLSRHFSPEKIVGINISEKQLELARINAPACDFKLMSATELTFPNESLDNIICVEAAFHFFTRRQFLEQALRVLKPGGTLVLSDFLMTREAEGRRETRTEQNYIEDLAEYEHLLQDAGFGRVQVEDATEQSWHRHYWHAVNYFHQEFLEGLINAEELKNRLHHTYLRVPDVKYYLLASCRKSD
ncbi:MAG: methyltransferase domain-containing protein [Gammaproteobacteria bacterium]|nr:methyltransferase domain-containing protein [Gammaproteobacteria bacterium]